MPVPQERLTSVTYQGVATQTRYTFHFDYLNKKFVKVLLTDSLYGTEQELTQNIDYTVYQKEITLTTPTNKIIKIYRKTDTRPTVSWEEGSVLRATDLTLQDTQVYHLIEESVEGNKTNSEMLNDAIHLANDAMTAASTATNKATEAANSATTATDAATTATNKAAEAATSAGTATQSSAANSATTAINAANMATTKAGEASTSATTATNAANNATTKATEAANSATTAINAANMATTKAGEASTSAAIATNSANASNLAAQNIGSLAFTTVALMNDNLAYAANTICLVTNDPTPANNGQYIKLGASGTGSWQKSAYVPPVVDRSINRLKLESPWLVNLMSFDASDCIVIDWQTKTIKVNKQCYFVYGTELYTIIPVADAQSITGSYNTIYLVYFDRATKLVKMRPHSSPIVGDYDILAVVLQDQIMCINPDLITIKNATGAVVSKKTKNVPLTIVDYGAVANGSTDNSAAIQSVATNGKKMIVPEGQFKASGLTTATCYGMEGRGNGSVITSNADAPLLTLAVNGLSVSDIRLWGADNAAYTSEKGIVLATDGQRLSGVKFEKFKGNSALYVTYVVNRHNTLIADACYFNDNNIGFFSDVRGEFCTFTGCHFVRNTIGAKIKGGNIKFIGCDFNNNIDGIHLLSGANDSHGIIANCQINHNSGYGLFIDGIVNGETITGCHFYESKICIKNTIYRAIRFDNCVIDTAELRIENCYKIIFNNCYFPGGYLKSASQLVFSSSGIEFNNCFAENSTIATLLVTQ